MSKYIEELMSPQLMIAVYGFIAFIVALYLLSVVYVFIDAKRRGIQAFWAWGLLALVPFVGLIAYIVMRPGSYALDREEQELDMALRERQLAQYGSCPQLRYHHREGLHRVPRVQHAGPQRLSHVQKAAGGPLEGVPVLPNSHPIGAPAPRVTHGASHSAPIRTRHRISMAGASLILPIWADKRVH